MADELNKKNPGLDGGSSSESVSAPKQAPAPKPQLAPKDSMPKKITVKPGNPNLGESAPVGIQRKRFESNKHVDKRLNKMFDETNASSLGIWNHDKKNDPMAKPDSVRFNPNLKYSPSQEQLKQAKLNSLAKPKLTVKQDPVQKQIMDQGFAPKEGSEPVKKRWYVNTLDNKDLSGDDFIEAETEEEAFKEAERRYPGHGDELNVYADEQSEPKKSEEPKAPKAPKFDYDSLSKELDGGEYINLDAGLLPYEHGFETNGHEDLAVDARKNPETGKYEVFMYPETENGPVSGYEPDSNEPTHVFDTFEDLKAFVENGYKKSEDQERAKASQLFGTNLNKR